LKQRKIGLLRQLISGKKANSHGTFYDRSRKKVTFLIQPASFSAHVKVYIFKRNYDAGKPAQALTVVTPIKQSAVLKRSLFFLTCHRKFHVNWPFFQRSTVLKDQFFFVSKMTS
jgi:hypothetical protein